MDKRVYYGEYSLQHWIDLIQKENIILPWYQRSFVWDKTQIENLIKTLDNNQFVPPIIIGAVRTNGEWTNFILDGQQRLTSILFARLNKYIDTKEFIHQKPNEEIKQVADDLPDQDNEGFVDEKMKMINWNFGQIIKDRKINQKELESSFYKKLLDNTKSDKWFHENFLGFAYIKPSNSIQDAHQSKFYSDIFRNINMGGTKLSRLENRKSLYFLKEELKNFFVPEFLNIFKVETSSKESGVVDFIKYLSILAQYKGYNTNLIKYGGRDWERNEDYYRKYIMAVVDGNQNNELKFDVSYPATPYNDERIANLSTALNQLDIPKSFPSIIDMDMYFFGLVYEIVFLNKQLDTNRKDELKNTISAKIDVLKGTENHRDNPNALKYLKARIWESLAIYKTFELQ